MLVSKYFLVAAVFANLFNVSTAVVGVDSAIAEAEAALAKCAATPSRKKRFKLGSPSDTSQPDDAELYPYFNGFVMGSMHMNMVGQNQPVGNSCHDKPIDVCIAIDHSGSVCGTGSCNNCGNCKEEGFSDEVCCANYEKQQDFATALVEELVTVGGEQFSVVSFSSDSQVTSELSNAATTIDSIKSVPYKGGGTNTGDAIADCRNSFTNNNSVKIIVLVTDGKPTKGGSGDALAHATFMANNAKAESITIIPVAVQTKAADIEFLQRLGSSAVPLVQVPTFDELSQKVDVIVALSKCSMSDSAGNVTECEYADWSIIFNDDFDVNSWEDSNWNDGGNDAELLERGHTDCPSTHTVNGCIRLRDGKGEESSMISNKFDVSGFSTIKLSFDFIVKGWESAEGFLMEYNADGMGWILFSLYNKGTHFENGDSIGKVSDSFSVPETVTNIELRVRASGDHDNDQVFIDNVKIEGSTCELPVAPTASPVVTLSPTTNEPTSYDATAAPTLLVTDTPTEKLDLGSACQKKALDVCIAVDYSGSVCAPHADFGSCGGCGSCQQSEFSLGTCCKNYQSEVDFASAFIDGVESLGDTQEFSVVMFSTVSSLKTGLTDATTAKTFITSAAYVGGGTNTGDAIADCHSTFVNSDTVKVIVLLTDGTPTQGGHDAFFHATSMANNAKADSITILPVAVKTHETDAGFLQSLGSDEQSIVWVEDFDELSTKVNDVLALTKCASSGIDAPDDIKWLEVFSDDFEGGTWEDTNWVPGGSDTKLYQWGDKKCPYGTSSGCVRLRKGNELKRAGMTSKNFEVTYFKMVRFSFEYSVHGFDASESFLLEYNADGKGWAIFSKYVHGTHFENGYSVGAVSDAFFVPVGVKTMQLRVRPDANSNNDHLFIDNMKVEGTGETSDSFSITTLPPTSSPTTQPSSSPTVSSAPTAWSPWTKIFYDDFDTGIKWGNMNWNDGGDHATHYLGAWMCPERKTGCIELKDGRSAEKASMISNEFDVYMFSLIRLQFEFRSISVENGDSFRVDYNVDGNGWVGFGKFTRGIDVFQDNDEVYKYSLTMYVPLGAKKMKIRIRADANSSNDKFYFDHCRVEGTKLSAEEVGASITTIGPTKSPTTASPTAPTSVSPTSKPVEDDVWSLVLFDHFNVNNWPDTNWNDGGGDASHLENGNNNCPHGAGNPCIQLRDGRNAKEASMVSDEFDVSSYNVMRFSFQYIAKNLGSYEGFVCEFMTGNNDSWVAFGRYFSGQHFNTGNTVHTFEAVFEVPEGTFNMKIRVRANGSGNNDQIFIDDCKIEGSEFSTGTHNITLTTVVPTRAPTSKPTSAPTHLS